MSDAVADESPRWDFPESVVLAILISYVCLFVDTLIKFWLLGNFVGLGVWPKVMYLGQWVSYSVAATLLAAVGVCWWRCSHWPEEPATSPNRSAVLTHVRRVRMLSQLLRGATGLATVCALSTLASLVFTNPPHGGFAFDARLDLSGLLEAASAIAFSLLGFKASSRIVIATTTQLNVALAPERPN